MSAPVQEWITTCSAPASTPAGIREAIVRDLMEVVGSQVGLYYNVAIIEGVPWYTDVVPYADTHDVETFRSMSCTKLTDWVDVNVSALTTLNSFCIHTKESIESNKMYATGWQPMQLMDCIGMSVVVGGELMGWIGAYRIEGEERFSPSALQKLKPRANAYIHGLEVARQLEGVRLGERVALLMRPNGEVAFMAEGAAEWVSEPSFASELSGLVSTAWEGSADDQEAVAAHICGAIVRLTPMSNDSERLILAEVAPAPRWQPTLLATMSLRKRQIAEFAAAGATMREIGKVLGCSPETVRTHLKGIYETLGVGSRLELADKVRENSI